MTGAPLHARYRMADGLCLVTLLLGRAFGIAMRRNPTSSQAQLMAALQ